MLKEGGLPSVELWQLASLFLLALCGLALARFGRLGLDALARRVEMRGRPVLASVASSLARAVGVAALAVAIKLLPALLLGEEAGISETIRVVANVLMILALGYAAFCLVDVLTVAIRRGVAGTSQQMNRMLLPLVRHSMQAVVVALTLLQVATQISDKPITSLLAGLGIGGLAVALAAQDTLKNFFGSLVIFTDKPFVPGDRVQVDNQDGVIETVGFRSTRMRTLEGHLVTLTNGDLASKTVVNVSRRPHIRRNATFYLPYDTPPEKARRAKEIVMDLLRDHEGYHPDFPPRVFFKEFTPSALEFQMLYWYHPPDFPKFMAFGERLNLEILDRFSREGISFAFPTQTLHLKRES